MVEVAFFCLFAVMEKFFFQLVVEVHIGQFPQVRFHFLFPACQGGIEFRPVVLHEFHVRVDAHVPEHEGHEHVVVISVVVQVQVIVDPVEQWLQQGADDDEAFTSIEDDFFQGLPHVAHPVQRVHGQHEIRLTGL